MHFSHNVFEYCGVADFVIAVRTQITEDHNTLGTRDERLFRRALMPTPRPGVLALEDGSVFRGRAFGAEATITGEAVFNTSMTGYQEILTDPSYFGQIVTMTAVQIGNYGINPEDEESAGGPKVAGFVVRELSPVASNWRSRQDLDAYLRQYGSPASRRSTRAPLPRSSASQAR